MGILSNTAFMKDYFIKDGSFMIAQYMKCLTEKDLDAPPPEPPRCVVPGESNPIAIIMKASYEPLIQRLVSLGFKREYVESAFRDSFGNADVTADFQIAPAPSEVCLEGEDGWTRIAMADGKVEVLGFCEDFDKAAQFVDPPCCSDMAVADDFVWVSSSLSACFSRP